MDFIKIENRKNWLLDIPKLHPDSTQYTLFWSDAKRKCIEGFWNKDFDGYRYMPGNLFFYVNFCRILDVDEATKTRISIKPILTDLMWELAYMVLEARGFSGWQNDNEFTSHWIVKEIEKHPENKKGLIKRLLEKNVKGEYKFKECFIDNNVDKPLKKFIHPRDNIRNLHKEVKGLPLYQNNAKNTMLFGCLGKDTKVRMFNGSTEKVQNLKVGDKLLGVDSTERTIKKLVRGSASLFEVSSRYGEPFVATDTHLLNLTKATQKQIKGSNKTEIIYEPINISVGEFLDIPEEKRKKFYQANMSKAIEYPKKELVWNPYLLGLWLGDGFKREKMICGSFKDDAETLNWLKNHINNHPDYESYKITEYTGQLGSQKLWRFSWIDSTMKYKNNWFSKTLRNNKHIPNEYLKSTIQDRLELLAGMIDSDGSVDSNQKRITITNTDLNLLKQFQEVARSCGFRAVINNPQKSGITNSLKYNLRITGELSKIPTLLARKKAKDSSLRKGSNKNDIYIKPLNIDNFYGFEVDKDNLFLLEDYTITHNSRGGGKSYFYALAVLLHEIVFDGAKEYTEETKKRPAEIHVNIGAALSDKSAELCEKIESCMNAFATDQELGVWGDESSDDYEPMPFYKSMAGSLTPNNAKSPWTHEYEKKINGRWLKFGSKSKIVHSVYKDNSHAAAGGRYTHVLVEECGLANNLREIHGSNIATTQRGTLKFGSQHYIGTSGDLEKVKEAREMFMNPQVYDVLSYDDVWENSGKIGFFIPAYYTAFEFKDDNGNTDLEAAKAYYNERREQKKKAKDPTQYQAELMNYPIKPSEMFLTKKSNVLPVAELEQHRINIITNQYKGKLETYGNLIFDPNSPRGVKFIPKPKHEAFPIKSFPTPKDYSLEGELIVYEFPITEPDGSVPPIYIIGYDPVHKDEEGSSLNCIHVLKTPKNFAKYGGNELVASYIGRPYAGRKPVNELAEKLAMWYGNKPRMIFFEAGGNNVKEYFEKRQKLNLLATQPTTVLTNKFSNSPTRSLVYGVPMNNLDIKMEAIGYLRDWLLQQRGTDENGRLIMNLNMINDTRLIEEMLSFDYDINTDSVMAFAMCIVGLEETHNQYKVEQVQKTENILDFLNRSIERKYSNYNYN